MSITTSTGRGLRAEALEHRVQPAAVEQAGERVHVHLRLERPVHFRDRLEPPLAQPQGLFERERLLAHPGDVLEQQHPAARLAAAERLLKRRGGHLVVPRADIQQLRQHAEVGALQHFAHQRLDLRAAEAGEGLPGRAVGAQAPRRRIGLHQPSPAVEEQHRVVQPLEQGAVAGWQDAEELVGDDQPAEQQRDRQEGEGGGVEAQQREAEEDVAEVCPDREAGDRQQGEEAQPVQARRGEGAASHGHHAPGQEAVEAERAEIEQRPVHVAHRGAGRIAQRPGAGGVEQPVPAVGEGRGREQQRPGQHGEALPARHRRIDAVGIAAVEQGPGRRQQPDGRPACLGEEDLALRPRHGDFQKSAGQPPEHRGLRQQEEAPAVEIRLPVDPEREQEHAAGDEGGKEQPRRDMDAREAVQDSALAVHPPHLTRTRGRGPSAGHAVRRPGTGHAAAAPLRTPHRQAPGQGAGRAGDPPRSYREARAGGSRLCLLRRDASVRGDHENSP
nr:hypothetical protein [Oceanicella sp. SM1341]